jgi:hypothetical protein
MCDKCVELDETIAKYCSFVSKVFDTLTQDRIKQAIAEMEARKVSLH